MNILLISVLGWIRDLWGGLCSCSLVFTSLRRMKQEYEEFDTILSYIATPPAQHAHTYIHTNTHIIKPQANK